MRTVGQVLKEERERKLYTLDEVEKSTKIRKELLEALEAGQYMKLPPPTFVQGFIKNYGKFLGLNTEKLLAIFRREYSSKKHPPRILESFSSPIDQKKFRITPARALGSVVLILVVVFFIYLWLEYRFLTKAPFLEITSPANQLSVDTPIISVIGRTDPEEKVTINNQEIPVDLSGQFTQEIKLSDNVNTIVISAISKEGKVTKVERTVFLKSTQR
ncbi:helix-turn-helix domain-containing protein [Candidatus Daviesbacteria bacterium]|nr:helix-turn-helix domain-containing protein [Candidatus Daviesbacteria bacterium]